MKTKKWITIGLISLALLIASVVLLFVLVLPGISSRKAMKALEEGDKAKAEELFMEMSSGKAEGFKDEVKDLIVYKANQCLKGEITYDDFFKVMSAVENVYSKDITYPFNGMTLEAFTVVNGPRMKKLYLDAVEDYIKNNNSTSANYSNLRNEFRSRENLECNGDYIYFMSENLNDTYKNSVIDPLDEEVKSQYKNYNAGTVEYDRMYAYADVAFDFWFSSTASDISDEMKYDKELKEALDKAKGYFDSQEYWDAIKSIDSTRSWYDSYDNYSKWESQFDTLYEEAENKAKTYYVEKAIEAAKAGDNTTVDEIIYDLKDHFGSDFDVSAIEQNKHTEWQMAYVAYFSGDWKADLKGEIDRINSEEDIFGLKSLDFNNMPSKMFLYDFDDDKTPELLLADENYIIIYTYYYGSIKLVGALPWSGLGDKPKLISHGKISYQDIEITANILLEYEDYDLEVVRVAFCATSQGQTVYGIGDDLDTDDMEEVDEAAYNAAIDEINAEIKTKTLTGGADIKDYETFIYSWKEQ